MHLMTANLDMNLRFHLLLLRRVLYAEICGKSCTEKPCIEKLYGEMARAIAHSIGKAMVKVVPLPCFE